MRDHGLAVRTVFDVEGHAVAALQVAIGVFRQEIHIVGETFVLDEAVIAPHRQQRALIFFVVGGGFLVARFVFGEQDVAFRPVAHFDHVHGIGGFVLQCVGSRGVACRAFVVFVFKLPEEQHHPDAERIELAQQRQVVAVAGQQHHEIIVLVVRLLERLQSQPHIDALFQLGSAATFEGQIVRGDPNSAEHLVEGPFAFQRHGIGVLRRAAPLEEMGIHNLTHAQFLRGKSLNASDLPLHKSMQAVEI